MLLRIIIFVAISSLAIARCPDDRVITLDSQHQDLDFHINIAHSVAVNGKDALRGGPGYHGPSNIMLTMVIQGKNNGEFSWRRLCFNVNAGYDMNCIFEGLTTDCDDDTGECTTSGKLLHQTADEPIGRLDRKVCIPRIRNVFPEGSEVQKVHRIIVNLKRGPPNTPKIVKKLFMKGCLI